MIEIAMMIEGQNGVNWNNWKRIARAVEDLGFAALYRSDHFTNSQPPDLDSLELWISLAWLASHTSRIEFGPLVSPLSFRHPALTARMASAVDDLSGGRLRLGLGAGWQEREHTNFSFDLLDMSQRFTRFEEGLKIISHLMQTDEPLTFQGKFYQLKDAVLLPRPLRPGGPPIVIGGNGSKRTLPLAARYAQEWNAVYLNAEKFRERSAQLDILLETLGRAAGSVRRSMMVGTAFGRDDHQVQSRLRGRKRQELRSMGVIVGSGSEVKDQISELEQAGVQRVMLQWLDLDDLDGLENLAKVLLY